MDETTYWLQDQDRQIEVRGRQLAIATSRQNGKQRWTDVHIYKTSSGRYVVSTIGKTQELGEQDFHRTIVSETAQGAVEALYQVDSDGIRYLTWTARQALDQASEMDEELREAYKVQVID